MNTLTIPEVATVKRGVTLSTVKTVLVKFFFTNPSHIPPGISQKKVTDRSQKDIRDWHVLLAGLKGRADLGEVGRVRPGHVDTGIQTVNNLQFVQLGVLRRGLTNSSFQLRETQSYFHEFKRKYVVVLTFRDGGYYEEETATAEEKAAHELLNSPATVEALRALGNTTWQWCHVWDNSLTAETATINVGGRLPDQKPRHGIAVRDGKIVDIQLAQALTESEE